MHKVTVAGGALALLLLVGTARAGSVTSVGAVAPLFSVGSMVGVIGHGDFDEGPTSGIVPANVYSAQGLTWVNGSLSAALPGVSNMGSAYLPQYQNVYAGYFPAPIGGGGTAVGVQSMFAGVATFSVVVTQVGLTASTNGVQYLTVWDHSGAMLGQVTWSPNSTSSFVGIDSLGVPIGMVAYGNHDVWSGQAYDIGGSTIINDSWIWALGTNVKTCSSSAQCDDGNPCTDDTCDVQGFCVHTNNTAPCNDQNACTQNDVCSGGACKGMNPVVCAASDGCHLIGVCNPTNGTCSNPAKSDGTACSDANACTQTDTCLNGVCSGANPVMCPPPDQCHTAGACDKTTGMCTIAPKPDGTACDDGDTCTQTDECFGGKCIGGNPVTCAGTDPCHDIGVCNPATGKCTTPAKMDGASCQAGECMHPGTCTTGTCTGMSPVPDGTPCSGGTCETGVCKPKETGTGGSGTGGSPSGTGGSPSGTGGSGTGGSFVLPGHGCGCRVADVPSGAASGVALMFLLALRRRKAPKQHG